MVLAKDDVGVPLVTNFALNVALAEPNKYEKERREMRGEIRELISCV